MRHFDSHAYRTEDEAGVWDFAAGSMRTYLIFKEKVAQFNADPEIQQLLAETQGSPARPSFKELRETTFDLAALRQRGYAYERLDQLTMELLLGVR
jgi:xylose isomerase